MADAFNTMSTLTGNFMEVYGDEVHKQPAGFDWLQRNIPIKEGKLVGNKYHQPVVLTFEHGVTRSAPSGGAFTLEDSVPAQMGDAQIEPYQFVLKATVDYETAFRGAQSKAAFRETVGLVVENMVESLKKEIECDLLYGQSPTGYGTTEASSASTSVVITDGEFVEAVWSGAKGKKVQLINAGFAASEDTDETISSITPATRTIVVGNAQTLDSGDVIFPKGCVTAGSPATWSMMAGVDAITLNTGTLFNISASTYPDTWKGTEVTVSGPPTVAALLNGVSRAVNRGCKEDMVALVSPQAYERLNSDLAGMRRMDSSYRPSKNDFGSEELGLVGQNGRLTIVPHIFVKPNSAWILPIKRMKRIGSTDITFRRPGSPTEIFKESSGVAGFELRCYSGQALYCERPSWLVKLSGLTYP